MIIAVTDANIFIDLIKLNLIRYLFEINLEIHTTREVFDQLHTHQQDLLSAFERQGCLTVYSFSAAEIIAIYELDMPRGLEPADRSVFYYAKKLNVAVLSGDNKLRKFCLSNQLVVRGILGVLSAMVLNDCISQTFGKQCLEKLMSYNDRLPAEECAKILKGWSSSEEL